MKIGILSDTHNNIENLQAALKLFRAHDISHLFHCGDLTGPEIAQALEGFHIIYTLGNVDTATGEIRQAIMALSPSNYAGLVYRGEVNGARIAATHGHLPGQVEALLQSGEHDYVFKGHSHRRQDETTGSTRLINPGALGGLHVQSRSVCILDLGTGKAEFIDVVP